jgi:hypothetical protein
MNQVGNQLVHCHDQLTCGEEANSVILHPAIIVLRWLSVRQVAVAKTGQGTR